MIDRWIKTYEKLLKWEWYGDPNMVAIWIHLLLKANWCDKKWRGITIKRGQLITSRTRLADEVGTSEQQTRTCLERLQSSGEITCETTNRYTIITICNYESYQGAKDMEQPAEQPAKTPTNDQQSTNNQPTNHQQATTPIEYIEGKEYIRTSRKKESVCPAPAREEFLETFGILGNVKMKAAEYRHLVEDYGEDITKETVDDLSCKLADGSVDSSNHYATLLSWLRYQRRSGGPVPLNSSQPQPKETNEEFVIRIAWQALTDQEKKDYMDTHGGKTLIETKGAI